MNFDYPSGTLNAKSSTDVLALRVAPAMFLALIAIFAWGDPSLFLLMLDSRIVALNFFITSLSALLGLSWWC